MRKAIVIGVGTYADSTLDLNNAVNDANLMNTKLQKAGFDCELFINPNLKDLLGAITEYKYAMRDYNEVLFYYAGHGFECEGSNYLTPSDFIISEEKFLRTAVNISALFESNYQKDIAQIFIFDACRTRFNNMKLRGNVSSQLEKFKAPTGSFVSYSTGPNSGASDGDKSNGLFTGILCEYILTPNIRIEDLFKKVRKKVIEYSASMQVPWENSSLLGNFYFVTNVSRLGNPSEGDFKSQFSEIDYTEDDEDLFEYDANRRYEVAKKSIDMKIKNSNFDEYYIISKTKSIARKRNLIQWWAPDRHGYCEKRSRAGIYSIREIHEIIYPYNHIISNTKSIAIPKALADSVFEYDIVPINDDLFDLLYDNENSIIGDIEFKLPKIMY